MASNGKAINGLQIMTPNTNSDSSPPDKPSSPSRLGKRSYDEMKRASSRIDSSDGGAVRPAKALTPIKTPPDSIPVPSDPRPPAGKIRALKVRYDSSDDRKKKSTYVAYGENLKAHGIRESGYVTAGKESTEVKALDILVADIKDDANTKPPDPRLALAGYAEGQWYQEGKPAKTRPRKALRITKAYSDDPSISIGRGPATQVVVYGFDPLTDERQIRVLLETFGSIARLENRMDVNGSNFGVCSVTYADKHTKHVQIKADEAARNAVKNGAGQKIGFKIVRIELDPIGARAKRICRKIADARQSQRDRLTKPQPPGPGTNGPPKGPAASFNPPTGPAVVPTGPANRSLAPPTGPANRVVAPVPAAPNALAKAPRDSHKVETVSILPTIGTKPYNFLAAAHVPVMGSIIEHIEKRMKSYNWDAVRCDASGYYIVFADTPYGREECERCYNECNGRALFTYTMHLMMRCRGNVTHEVTQPAPVAGKPTTVTSGATSKKRLWEEDKADFEEEKKEKARRLDPVNGAVEDVAVKLLARLLEDVKTRYCAPTIYDRLDPDLHKERREKHGIPDPKEKRTGIFDVVDNVPLNPLQTIASPLGGTTISTSSSRIWRANPAPKRAVQSRFQRAVQPQITTSSADPYADERRRKVRKPKAPESHRRIQDMLFNEPESDDDSHTVITRGSGDADSRAVSEVPDTPMHVQTETSLAPAVLKRRKKDEKPDDEDTATIRQYLPHLLGKEPEDMALRELEQLVTTLPRTSALRKRALNEVSFRKQAEADDALFGLEGKLSAAADTSKVVLDDVEPVSTPEPTPEVVLPAKKKTTKAPAKPKKKTKKQILEEQEAAAKEAEAKATLLAALEQEDAPTPAEEEVEEPEEPEEDIRADVEWSVSTDMPRRTVEDDPDLILDIAGWQQTIKDDEDLQFLRLAHADLKPAKISDVNLWAWDRKQIKALNNGGKWNVTNNVPEITGYYKPNPTGCAGTEPITKILNSEKNDYLPHRIRVREAREAREAREKQGLANPAEAAKAPTTAVKLNQRQASRQARVDNRRAVANIGLGDVSLSYNQLTKRKKQVRFDRSAIHNWGLYADENIGHGEMIIEYVGEVVRQKVADMREMRYDQQGVGSSYLFRLSDDRIVDATKKGGIARFINHSCSPSCTAKIIKVAETHRIVIYALRDILKNEELTYDYKFEREINSEDRIPCLCGADNCKGFLN